MENEEKILSEIQELKAIVARLIGTSTLSNGEQFSTEALNKAAEEFQTLFKERGEWIGEREIVPYLGEVYHNLGKFIRVEFEFANYFKKGYDYYYNKNDIIALGKELKSRNIDLKRYIELRNDQAIFERCVAAISSQSSKKAFPRPFNIPTELRDILTTPAKRPSPEVMREALEKLKDEFFENKLGDYVDISRSNYAMLKEIYYFEKYLDPKIKKRSRNWCDEFNVVNRILKEITNKKVEKFIPVKEEERIRL